MTDEEGHYAIKVGREEGATLELNLSHEKRGKSGKRYQVYKHFKTFDDVDTAVLNKTMLPVTR